MDKLTQGYVVAHATAIGLGPTTTEAETKAMNHKQAFFENVCRTVDAAMPDIDRLWTETQGPRNIKELLENTIARTSLRPAYQPEFTALDRRLNELLTAVTMHWGGVEDDGTPIVPEVVDALHAAVRQRIYNRIVRR